jgi:hypothetical protein
MHEMATAVSHRELSANPGRQDHLQLCLSLDNSSPPSSPQLTRLKNGHANADELVRIRTKKLPNAHNSDTQADTQRDRDRKELQQRNHAHQQQHSFNALLFSVVYSSSSS